MVLYIHYHLCYLYLGRFYWEENLFMFAYLRKLLVKNDISSSNSCLNADQIIAFLKEFGGNHVSHLILLKDKEVYWSTSQKVLIVYKRIANSYVVLGDPIGETSFIKDAIKEFYQFSEANGCKAIFYQVSPQYMSLYHETGYRFLKLGEEGLVKLQNFTLEGKQGAKLRTRFNKFTRHAYEFKVVHPPYTKDFLEELELISDSWLGGQKEKGFSVVSFSQDYVSCFPIAQLVNPEGKTIAFATLATDFKDNISIDLMRKTSDSPHGTMDVLFIHILKWSKDKGYKTCSLGMSPLSNVGTCKYSFISEKLIRLAYVHGNVFYNFKGLKEFKSKFACSWEPKYLAYKKTFLPATLIQLLLLINRSPKQHSPFPNKMKDFFQKVG